MAQDKHRRDLHVGDVINVVCVVSAVEPNLHGLNIMVTPRDSVVFDGSPQPWLLNSRQVELVHSIGDTSCDVNIKEALRGS